MNADQEERRKGMIGRVRRSFLPLCLYLCSSALICGEIRAELPQIRLDGIFPLGGQTGSEVLLDNNGEDFFRFSAKKGEHVVIDCQAFRLGSTLRALLTLSAADGTELLRSRPYYNRTDPLLDFVAPADGEYVLRLHDATFLGNLP